MGSIFKYNTENISKIKFHGKALEQLEIFTYLISIINKRGGSDAYVKTRIRKVMVASLQFKNIRNSKQLSVSQHQSYNLQYECQDSSTVQS